MRKILLGIILVILSGGCGGTGLAAPSLTNTPVPSVTPTATPEPECNANAAPDFTGYASWAKVNFKPIQGHETYVNIYVNDAAEDNYLSASGDTFPECSMIVKTHLVSAEDESITAVTVMVKMPAGYDPNHNDWWWGMYDKDGKVAEMNGKVQVCIACHQPVADADYVFSQKVMEEINK